MPKWRPAYGKRADIHEAFLSLGVRTDLGFEGLRKREAPSYPLVLLSVLFRVNP
jgi:hypothetical protein